jgi:hypothetical protein
VKSPVWGGVDYPVTQPFLPGPPALHCGIDIGCPSGTIIHAARAGMVERVQVGMVGILVDGGAQRDFYLHGYSLVVVGQRVAAGTPVIHSDTVQVDPRYPLTGPHLHFEVQDDYSLPGAPPQYPEHPLDPVPVLTGLFGGLPGPREEDVTHSEKRALCRLAYVAALGREPESDAALDGHANSILDDGSNADAVVTAIVDSPEGIAHLAAVKTALAGSASHVHQVAASKTGPAV